MAPLPRNLLDRGGRYFSRLVVPAKPPELRERIGRNELRTALGGDRREAIRRHPGALARLQAIVEAARRGSAIPGGEPAPRPATVLDATALAAHHANRSVQFDTELREVDPRYARSEPDDTNVAALRVIASGAGTDDQLAELIDAPHLARYRDEGLCATKRGDPDWRTTCQQLAVADLLAMDLIFRRFDGDPAALAGNPFPAPVQPTPGPSLEGLFADYLATLTNAGTLADYSRFLAAFRDHLGHDDATRVTKSDVIAWTDALLARPLAPATVKGRWLGAVNAAFGHAHGRDKLPINPAANIKIKVPRKKQNRERGYTDAEADAALKVAAAYVPGPRESAELSAAKRWLPLLARYTGARAAELGQLRAEDVRERDDLPMIRLAPDAGSIKSGLFRDVPLHPAVIDAGFLAFASGKRGPLFHRGTKTGPTNAGKRVAEFLREAANVPGEVDPMHGFRHLFRTLGLDAGVNEAVLKDLMGHERGKGAHDNYGDVRFKAMAKALDQMFAGG